MVSAMHVLALTPRKVILACQEPTTVSKTSIAAFTGALVATGLQSGWSGRQWQETSGCPLQRQAAAANVCLTAPL